MTIWPKLAIALLPGGTLALAAMALFRCRHRHEVLFRLALASDSDNLFGGSEHSRIDGERTPAIADTRWTGRHGAVAKYDGAIRQGAERLAGAMVASGRGRMGLRCTTCGRTRPHPFSGEPVRYHRTQNARPEPMTGIEREAERQAAERRAVSETLTLVEWQTRRREISERVKEWEARKAATASAFRAWEEERHGA